MFGVDDVLLLPYNVRQYLIDDPIVLHGSWIEFEKDVSGMDAVMKTLKVAPIRRRVAASAKTTVDISVEPIVSRYTTSNTSTAVTATLSVTSTRDSSPSTTDRVDEDEADPVLPELKVETQKLYNWRFTQYLPRKNIKAGEICANWEPHTQTDTDTGTWITRAVWMSGMLVQVRYSESLNLHMSETRGVLNRKPCLIDGSTTVSAKRLEIESSADGGGQKESDETKIKNDSNSCNNESLNVEEYQVFFWRVWSDENKEDAKEAFSILTRVCSNS